MGKISPFLKNLIQLNIAMVLISTSGVLGRAISLSPPLTIGLRAILAGLLLFAFLKWKKINLKIAKKDRWNILLGGILFGIHWTAYFQALQLSTVAIGMLTIYTYPTWTSILSPMILKTRFQKVHLLLGLLVIAGIFFLVPEFDFENKYTQAVAFGLFSALAYALRNILMKKQVENYHGSLLMWYQMIIIGVLLLPVSITVSAEELIDSLPILITLALVTTALGHTLFLMTFKHFNITTASIISSVQPVYGILIGLVVLGEVPQAGTIIGGCLILSAVIFESLRVARIQKKQRLQLLKGD
ncbi:MAG: DMT family transporter [Leeuwenhoekiella sp.]